MAQLVKIADANALDDATAESLARNGATGFRGALDDIIAIIVGAVLGGEVVAPGNVSVTQGAAWDIDWTVVGGVATLNVTVPPGGVAWDKTATALTSGTNLSTLEAGVYRVGNSTVATALGLPIKDVSSLTVVQLGTTASLEQTGYDGAGGAVKATAWRDQNGIVGEWTAVQKAWDKTSGLLTTGTDFAALTPGLYHVPNKAVAAALDLPIRDVGYVQVVKHGVTASFEQTVYAGTGRGPLKATAWRDQFGVVGEWTVADARDEHLVRERAMQLRASKKVTTPGGVVLVFDHGLTKFKSTIWPLLQARGIPVTLAINPGTMTAAQNSGASYADIQSWIGTGLVEPANHSYDHANVAVGDAAALDRAVRGSREELESQLGVPVDSWVHPGNDLSEFVVTDTDPNVYATTDAGRLILASHGAVSGVASAGAAVRPLGEPLLGLNGIWIDSGTGPAQTAIQAAIDGGGYQIVRFHPQFLNDSGYLTTAQLTTFLDWIKGKVDAGQLTALTFRESLSAEHDSADAAMAAYLAAVA